MILAKSFWALNNAKLIIIPFDKPDGAIHPDTIKHEEQAINDNIVSRTITVQTKQGDSSKAPISTH